MRLDSLGKGQPGGKPRPEHFGSHRGQRHLHHGQNILAAIAGSATYMVLYLGKSFIEGMLLGSALGPVLLSVATKAVTSGVNAVIAVIVSVPLCAAIRLALKKSHLLEKLG